jgi:hypothetical protein
MRSPSTGTRRWSIWQGQWKRWFPYSDCIETGQSQHRAKPQLID